MRMLGIVTLLLAACSKPAAGPPASAPEPAREEPTPADDAAGEARPGISAADCEAQGGKVVGDIGDGAIHRADYRCPDSDEAPIGSIIAEPGGPVAVEGAVCCT